METQTKSTSFVIISAPKAGENIGIENSQAHAYKLDMNLASASFVRSENNLVIESDQGGTVTLTNYFVVGEGYQLPDFVLEDGQTVAGSDFLRAQSPDMDIATAAGPSAASQSSGLGDYNADAGSLLSGVDRLGSLAGLTDATSSARLATATGEGLLQPAATTEDAPTPTPGPTPVPPPPAIEGRAVLFKTDADAGESVNFRLVGEDGSVANPATAQVTITGKNGYFLLPPTMNADGSLSLTLSPAGLAAMAASGGANIYDYLTITVDGHTYTMQVVVNEDGQYDSAAEDALLPADYTMADSSREWQTEAGGTGSGTRADSAGADEIWYSAKAGDAQAFQGMLNTGDGADTIHIQGSGKALQGATITAGAGADVVNITGSVNTSTVDLGAGDNALSINGAVLSGSTITADAGNDTVSITGNLDTSSSVTLGEGNNALTVGGNSNGTIIAGSGNDKLNVYNNTGTINSGAGNDTVVINSSNTSTGTVNLGEGNNELYVYSKSDGTIIAGSGNDKVYIASTSTGSINLGDGENTLSMSSQNNASITTGMGNDSVEISGSSNNTINLGDGNNILKIGKSGSITGISTGVITAGNGNDSVTIYGEGITTGAINLSEGENQLTVKGTVKTNVTTGSGNDTLDIASLGSGTVDAGAGNDSIVLGNMTGGTLNTGEGDDSVTVASDHQGLINLGKGDNLLTIAGNSSGASISGTGNDTITVGSLTNGAINASSGDNIIHITGDITYGGTPGSVDKIQIQAVETGGNTPGNNEIIVDGNIVGTTYSSDYRRVGINTGSGDDSLTVKGSVHNGTFYLGDGNNTINLQNSVTGKSDIVTYDGDDTVSIAGNVSSESLISLGNGKNILNIGGDSSAKITAGTGNDSVTIKGTGTVTNTIDLGIPLLHILTDPIFIVRNRLINTLL